MTGYEGPHCSVCHTPFVREPCPKCNGSGKLGVEKGGQEIKIDCDACSARGNRTRPGCVHVDPYVKAAMMPAPAPPDVTKAADAPAKEPCCCPEHEADNKIRAEWAFDNGCPY